MFYNILQAFSQYDPTENSTKFNGLEDTSTPGPNAVIINHLNAELVRDSISEPSNHVTGFIRGWFGAEPHPLHRVILPITYLIQYMSTVPGPPVRWLVKTVENAYSRCPDTSSKLIFFLYLNLNICCGYSEEPSR